MSISPFVCPVSDCRCHNTILYAEIAQSKGHLKTYDYRILLETAYNLGIISSLDERRSVNWLVDELFKLGRLTAGIALH